MDFENDKGDNMFEDSDARATNYYFVTICSHFRDTMRKIQNKKKSFIKKIHQMPPTHPSTHPPTATKSNNK